MGLPPTSRSVTGVLAYGAAIKRDDTYCDETVAASSITPPSKPPAASTWMGRQPLPPRYFTLTPLASSESTSGPIGRCFMRALPVRTVDEAAPVGVQRATTVVRNRDAVP